MNSAFPVRHTRLGQLWPSAVGRSAAAAGKQSSEGGEMGILSTTLPAWGVWRTPVWHSTGEYTSAEMMLKASLLRAKLFL